jgi:hypothetical protein
VQSPFLLFRVLADGQAPVARGREVRHRSATACHAYNPASPSTVLILAAVHVAFPLPQD